MHRCRTPQWHELGTCVREKAAAAAMDGECSDQGGGSPEVRRPGWHHGGHVRTLDFILSAVWAIIIKAAYSILWIVLTIKDFFLK